MPLQKKWAVNGATILNPPLTTTMTDTVYKCSYTRNAS